jgi:Putative esterase
MRHALCGLALFLVTTPAYADDDAPPRPPVEIAAQSFRVPGPGEGETRDVFVWRPAGAEGVLPVLYMADGFTGLRLVAHQIAPYIATGEAPPIMIVATAAHPYERTREYAPPYRERMQRAVGGYSNGGDFAVAMAAHRPDLFGLVLVHAPANPREQWVLPSAATQRWLVTGGTRDFDGEVARELDRQLAPLGAYRRVCIGPWEHTQAPWRQLSRGSAMWLFGNTEAAALMASEREARYCEDVTQ